MIAVARVDEDKSLAANLQPVKEALECNFRFQCGAIEVLTLQASKDVFLSAAAIAPFPPAESFLQSRSPVQHNSNWIKCRITTLGID
jgi:hypothetical protein